MLKPVLSQLNPSTGEKFLSLWIQGAVNQPMRCGDGTFFAFQEGKAVLI